MVSVNATVICIREPGPEVVGCRGRCGMWDVGCGQLAARMLELMWAMLH